MSILTSAKFDSVENVVSEKENSQQSWSAAENDVLTLLDVSTHQKLSVFEWLQEEFPMKPIDV